MISTKLKLFQSNSINRIDCVAECKTMYDIFTKYFELPHNKATQYLEKYNFHLADYELVSKTTNYCKQLGFDKCDLLHYPGLLKTNPITIENHYSVMVEGGFFKISPEILSRFISLQRKTVEDLKESAFIKADTNVADSFVSYLDPKPDDFAVPSKDAEQWGNIHKNVLVEYLQWRLDATAEDINNLFRVHGKDILRKSMRRYCKNLEYAFDLGFSKEKILKYGYILKNYPPYTQETLEKYGNLAGVNMRHEMRKYPKLIGTPPKNYEKIYKLLKDYDISDKAIQYRASVFHLAPTTVEQRLVDLKRIPELRVLLNDHKVLLLVIHHKRASRRLDFLKEKHWRCSGVKVLSVNDDYFDVYWKGGRDINKLQEIKTFLKRLFERDMSDKMANLKIHPFYKQVPFTEMERTYNYLLSEKIRRNTISSVLSILLYPKEKIRNTLEQIRTNNIIDNNTNQMEILNLIIYFIEKEHHFTGNGIWTNNEETEINT